MARNDDWWRGVGRLAATTGLDRRAASTLVEHLRARRRRTPPAAPAEDPTDADLTDAATTEAAVAAPEASDSPVTTIPPPAAWADDPTAPGSATPWGPSIGTRTVGEHWHAAQPGVRVLVRLGSLVAAVAIVGGLVAAVGVAVAPHGQSLVTAAEGERESQELQLVQGAERSKMFDSYGGVMAILRDAEDREWIPLDRMPDSVIRGILAVEDADFYEHDGVDWVATIRAASENVAAGEVTQGGSTLTQQLVKLQFVGADQTLERKIREAMLALDLEEQYSKDAILEHYLNTIYFGNSAYGVQAAAEIYFGKTAAELDLGDVALLAGFIRSPGVFTFSDPDIDFARERRSRSLERMLDLGLLTEEEAAEVELRPIPTFSRSPNEDLAIDYFAEEVKRRLLEMPELGATREARRQAVFQGGLRIYTTFDPELDQAAQDAVAEVFPDRSVLDPFTVALASVDPSTGAIRAMLGGNDFTEEEFNLATQGRRQPGSSFKTYVLAAALEQGTVPSDIINGSGPCRFDVGPGTPDYEVRNFAGGGGSLGSIAQQTQRSSNCAFVRLGLYAGLEEVVETTTEMIGLEEGRLLPYPSMSLGAQELTPLEQAVGYAVIANDGMRMEPFLISRIEDRNGNTIFEHVPTGRQVISEQTARSITEVLEGNVRGGTGRAAILASGQPSAGKTGTAQNFEDAWFAGYTPQLATAVWMGHPEEKVQMRGVGGRNVTGGSYPTQVWSAFMSRALASEPVVPFEDALGSSRSRDFIFLPGERCNVSVPIPGGSQVFSIGCDEVAIGGGGFSAGPEAICRGVQVPLPDGSTETRDVPCSEVERVLTPPEPEPEPEPPPGDGESTDESTPEESTDED